MIRAVQSEEQARRQSAARRSEVLVCPEVSPEGVSGFGAYVHGERAGWSDALRDAIAAGKRRLNQLSLPLEGVAS